MEDISSNNRVTNASDVGLIVQGSLILLSAIVALLGYSMQSKLRKKERRLELEEQHRDYLRKAELDLLRTKLRTFVGPATQLCMCAWNTMWRNCFSVESLKKMSAAEAHGAGVPLTNLNALAGGDRVHKHWNNSVEEGGMGFGFFPQLLKGQWNGVVSFVGIAVEEEIRQEPTSKLALFYFQFCKRIVRRYAVPLRDLFLQHSQTLDVRHSVDEFKKEFPVLKQAGWLRNLLYIDFIEWVNSFEEILKEWESGVYDVLFPCEVNFPLQLVQSLTNQLTELREKETELGTGQHKVFDEEVNRIKAMEIKAKNDAGGGSDKGGGGGEKTTSNKYVKH